MRISDSHVRLSVAGFSGMLAIALAAAVWGQDRTPKPQADQPTVNLSGIVKDEAGQAIGGATVWLVGGHYTDKAKSMAETTTDAAGKFSFAVHPEEFFEMGLRRPGLVARSADGRLGGRRDVWNVRETVPSAPVTITLLPVHEFRGRIVDASNKPITAASFRPIMISSVPFGGRPDMPAPIFELPAEFAKALDAKTDTDGAFAIKSLPSGGGMFADLSLSGTNSIRVVLNTSGSPTITIGPTATIRGTVQLPPEASSLKSIKVTARLESDNSIVDLATVGYRLTYFQTAEVGKDGKFQFDTVLPGKCVISVETDRQSGFLADAVPPLDVAAGATVADVAIPIRRGLRIEGRVVDGTTGAGVAGVTVSGLYKAQGRYSWVGNATTGPDGKYSLYVRAGDIAVQVQQTPKEFQTPSFRSQPSYRQVTADCTWADLPLERARVLKGVVVDPSGKPVPGAKVYAIAREGMGQNPKATTDAKGEFSLQQLRPNDQVWIHAITETAATGDVVTFTPADLKDTIKLVVSETSACRVRGIVVDEKDAPIAGATVEVQVLWMTSQWGTRFTVETKTTDASGAFASSALWPGVSYHTIATGEKREKRESAEVKLTAGQVHDLGRIPLRSASESVEGSVTDSAGQPVADVEVFNRGDGPKMVTTHTDAKGHFRLEGLYSGRAYVFAEKDGFRCTATAATAGARDVRLALLRRDEPIPPRTSGAASPEKEKQLVRSLLEAAWPVRKERGERGYMVEHMEKVDAEQAKRWAAEMSQGGPRKPEAPRVEKVAETDLDEALSLVAERNHRDAFYQLKALAEKFRKSAPEKAARCAEEALMRARAMDQPQRAQALADAGSLLVRLGNVEAGRKTLEEAADGAANLGPDARSIRQSVASQLAPYDLAKTLKLIDRIDEQERSMAKSSVVVALAATDPAKALELVNTLEPWNQNRARAQIAYKVAPTKAPEAIRIVEQMKGQADQDAAQDQAEAFAWLAGVVAAKDKDAACVLIDRALRLCRSESRSFQWGRQRCRVAALAAAQAAKIGYPDMESVANRVLAARPSASEYYSPVESLRDLSQAAILMAAVDPRAARVLLEELVSRKDLLTEDNYGLLDRRQWLVVWALVDLDRAQKMAEEQMTLLREKPKTSPEATGLVEMLDLLVLPPKERLEQIMSRYGRSYGWSPDED